MNWFQWMNPLLTRSFLSVYELGSNPLGISNYPETFHTRIGIHKCMCKHTIICLNKIHLQKHKTNTWYRSIELPVVIIQEILSYTDVTQKSSFTQTTFLYKILIAIFKYVVHVFTKLNPSENLNIFFSYYL